MTQAEESAIREISGDVRELTAKVIDHITRCEENDRKVAKHEADLYGVAGQSKEPGIAGRVLMLEEKWNAVRIGVHIAWALIAAAIGVAVHFLGK